MRTTLVAALLPLVFASCVAPDPRARDATGTDSRADAATDACDDNVSEKDKGPTPEDPGPVPSFADNDAILDYCTAVLLGCPPVSRSTVPADWQMVLVNDDGCTLYAPLGWVSTIDGATLNVTIDPSGTAGYFIMATYVQGVDWNEVSLAALLKQELLKLYPDLVVLKEETLTDPYGLGLKIRVVSIKFKKSGVATVGVIRVIHYECSLILGNCPLTASGTWVPLADVDSLACTLAQIDASLRCPTGGGYECSEGSCEANCKSMGYTDGHCAGDDCTCE